LKTIPKPLISVLIASYNNEQFINQTIESCLNQNYHNYEIIISDDYSSDNSWKLINSYSNDKIRAYSQDQNLGEYENRIFCLDKAIGEYVIFIDGEDLLYPHALHTISNYLTTYTSACQLIARDWDERIIYPRLIGPKDFIELEFFYFGIIALNFTRVVFKKSHLSRKVKNISAPPKLIDVFFQYEIGKEYNSLLIPSGFSWWRRRSGQASESLLSDAFYMYEEMSKIQIPAILNSTHLSKEKQNLAMSNVMGQHFRRMIYQTIKGDFKAIHKLFKAIIISEFRYIIISSIFKKTRTPLKDKYSGVAPF